MIAQFKRVGALAVMLALTANTALAQGGPPWQWGWSFWWFPGLRILLVLGCVALLVVIIVRIMQRPGASRNVVGLDILNERLARGEIDKTEYEEKRRLIMGA